jgi:hypothetical protein
MNRLFKCIKAWILWMLLMAIPTFIFKYSFYFEASKWDIILNIFLISFSVLLLCENLLYIFFRYLRRFQFLILLLVFISSEFIYSNLSWSVTKVNYDETWLFNVVFILFTVFAAGLINKFIFKQKRIVIIQKEI